MKSFKPEQIRNVALIGHGTSGKTSLAEVMLFLAGASDRIGKVGDNSSLLDYDPDEVKRGLSINASLAYFEWQKNKINLLDTPGTNNFIGDTPGCIRVVDGGLLVVSAVEGVQFYTEKVWQWADQWELPRVVFVNKMDHEQADIRSVAEGIQKKFGVHPVLMQMPVGSGDEFSGVVDLVQEKYYAYERDGSGKGEAKDIPDDLMDEVETWRAELVEMVAEADDHLIEVYLEKGELSEQEFHDGLAAGIANGTLVPVYCGSALHNLGVDRLLDALVEYLPSPVSRPPQKAQSIQGENEVEVKCDPNGPLSALVFKTISDPYAGKLTLFRVYSGSMKADTSVFNPNQDSNERIGQMFSLQGKKQEPMKEVVAGDIGVVAKLKSTATGDSLSADNKGARYAPMVFPKAVLARAMVPKTRQDEEKISTALGRLLEEDPSLTVERDPQTHELVVSGMGAVHLDVILDRMKRRFSVEVNVKPPKVPYRETIRGHTKVQGKHKKQSGGRGQYGDCWLEISPLTKGAGFEFENRIVGGAIPKGYIPAVEKGVVEAMALGVIAHYPMVDVKVAVYDGSYHDVDSSEMAFKIAASMGFKKGVLDCRPILLEPIMQVVVIVPGETVGDVIGDLNSKRGKILGVDASGDVQNIRAHVPMASLLNYAPELRAMTGGRGMFEMEFDHYDDVPDHVAQKIIEESKSTEKKDNE